MKRFPSLIFIIFFIITAFILHHKSWDKPPTSLHAWSQSDHYTLSLGFLENDFDFFHPKTYSLNHQFSPRKELKNPSGITAADFPILHYSVAGLMNLLDNTSPWVFRMVSLFWSFIALWVLFDTVSQIKGSGIALLFCGFVMFQPIYVYYQNGINISSPAFNTLLIGMCFMMKYFKTRKYSLFLYGLCFMTVAALMRFTQVISLIAFGCMCILSVIRNKKWDSRLSWTIVGVLMVIGYFIYNQYLALNFGSIWLNKPVVADSIGDLFKQILRIGYSYVKYFLPPFHLIIMGLILALGIKNYRQEKGKFDEMLYWILFVIIGASLFTLLMAKQLAEHDYYSLDVWMPVIVLLLLFFINKIDPKFLFHKKWEKIGITFLILSFALAVYIQEKHYTWEFEESIEDSVISTFIKSSVFLDSIVPKNAKVLIICHGGWNEPMVGWQRNAFRVAQNNTQRIPNELSSASYDYIVTHDLNFKNEVLPAYPDFHNVLQKVSGNGLVTVWKKF